MEFVKKCSRCGLIKPLSEYHANGRGGHRSDCKPCVISYNVEFRNAPRVEKPPPSFKERASETSLIISSMWKPPIQP